MVVLNIMTFVMIFLSVTTVIGGLMELGNPQSSLSIPERLFVISIAASPIASPFILVMFIGSLYDIACTSHLKTVEKRYGNNA